jgi:hypothetical protein
MQINFLGKKTHEVQELFLDKEKCEIRMAEEFLGQKNDFFSLQAFCRNSIFILSIFALLCTQLVILASS